MRRLGRLLQNKLPDQQAACSSSSVPVRRCCRRSCVAVPDPPSTSVKIANAFCPEEAVANNLPDLSSPCQEIGNKVDFCIGSMLESPPTLLLGGIHHCPRIQRQWHLPPLQHRSHRPASQEW